MRSDARKSGVLTTIIGEVHQRLGFTEGGTEILARREVLLCGHIVRVVEDIYGETNAYRRRCRKCGNLRDRVNALGGRNES